MACFSRPLGFAAGWIIVKAIDKLCVNVDRQRADEVFGHKVVGSAFAAAMHGAQDGQKFMSIVMLLPHSFRRSWSCWCRWARSAAGDVPRSYVIGTAIGGRKIIKKSEWNGALERYQGFAASSAGIFAALHTDRSSRFNNSYKNDRQDGCGCCKNIRSVNWGVAKNGCSMAFTSWLKLVFLQNCPMIF